MISAIGRFVRFMTAGMARSEHVLASRLGLLGIAVVQYCGTVAQAEHQAKHKFS